MKRHPITLLLTVLLFAIPCFNVFAQDDEREINRAAPVETSLKAIERFRVVLPEKSSQRLEAIVSVFARQVEQHCPAKVVTQGEGQLTVSLTIDPAIGKEGFRIKDKPGGDIEVAGQNELGLLYGLGKLLAAAIAFPPAATLAAEPPHKTASPAATENHWYPGSWIHSHVSISPSAAELDSVLGQIDVATLDAVQFHTHGLALWDAVKAARQERKLDFNMVATINHAGSWRRGYDVDPAYVKRTHPDGSFAGRWDKPHLCFNAPVVRERIIPESYGKLPARLQPDQVWIDESIVTVNLCWCEHCTKLYREQHQAAPPTNLHEDNRDEWTRWVTFHRKSYERWTRDVHTAVNEAMPGTLVTFNHAWIVDQPETPPAYVKNLSADIYNNPLELGIAARYAGSFDLPFDLMPGLGSDIWGGVTPKTPDQIRRDISLIVAHSGRWNAGEYPTDATSVRKEHRQSVGKRSVESYRAMAELGGKFARERQAFSQHTRPVPHVALLHAASTHYDHVITHTTTPSGGGFGITTDGTIQPNEKGKINSRIYWPNNHPVAENVVGAYQALVETHTHFNFITEDRLKNGLSGVALLVIPEQHRLSPNAAAAIRAYLQGGGHVLATGRTREAGLDDLLDYESAKPRTVDKGTSLYLSEDFFHLYHRGSPLSRRPTGDGDAMRKRAAGIFRTLLPESPYTFEAPPWIEWTVRRSADNSVLLFHLINRSLDWKPAPAADSTPLRASVALQSKPTAVTLEPGGDKPAWSYEKGRLSLELNPKELSHHRIIRIVD